MGNQGAEGQEGDQRTDAAAGIANGEAGVRQADDGPLPVQGDSQSLHGKRPEVGDQELQGERKRRDDPHGKREHKGEKPEREGDIFRDCRAQEIQADTDDKEQDGKTGGEEHMGPDASHMHQQGNGHKEQPDSRSRKRHAAQFVPLPPDQPAADQRYQKAVGIVGIGVRVPLVQPEEGRKIGIHKEPNGNTTQCPCHPIRMFCDPSRCYCIHSLFTLCNFM